MSEHLIKLQEALAEVTQAKAEVESRSDVAAIDELVAEYRVKITAEFADKKAQDLAEKDLTIKIINGLIAKAELAADCKCASDEQIAVEEVPANE